MGEREVNFDAKKVNFDAKKDKIRDFLVPQLKNYVFDEFTDEYLRKQGVLDILKGVPIPFDKEDLAGGKTSTLKIASSMSFVIGCDPEFNYVSEYLSYIHEKYSTEFAKGLVNQGLASAEAENFVSACIFFRAAILVNPEMTDALFLYARACHDAYEKSEDEAFIGSFKAESLTMFEQYTMIEPEDAAGYYYLGYAYLNLGLYIKAKLTFESFMRFSDNGEMKKEVSQRLEGLEDPVIIEEGCNAVLTGRFESAIEILSMYKDREGFNTWWPLWFYLGVAYRGLADLDNAEAHLREALRYSPSNLEVMEQLVEIYGLNGDLESQKKYMNKMEVVRGNMEMDREQKRQQDGMTVS